MVSFTEVVERRPRIQSPLTLRERHRVARGANYNRAPIMYRNTAGIVISQRAPIVDTNRSSFPWKKGRNRIYSAAEFTFCTIIM
jgi:hypothetical protein